MAQTREDLIAHYDTQEVLLETKEVGVVLAPEENPLAKYTPEHYAFVALDYIPGPPGA